MEIWPDSFMMQTEAKMTAQAPESTDPLQLLDGIIRELEQARTRALILVATVGPTERATLASALSELEARLADAKAKRDDVRQRVARTTHIRALAAEMATLKAEADAALRGELDAKRAAEVRARIEEIREEAMGLKTSR